VKIVVIEFAGKGGMIHYVFQLCRAMARSGADVTLITARNYELSELPHDFEVETLIDLWDPKPAGRLSMTPWAIAGRKLRRLGRAVRHYRQWLRVIRRVASIEPDVVQLGDIRFPFDLFPLLLLRRKARLLTDICHNVHPFSAGGASKGLFDRSSWGQRFYRRIYRQFDLVFVHFERNREEFQKSFGVPAHRIGVIVHGNEEIFNDLRSTAVDPSTLRKRIGLGVDDPVVLFFGTLSRYKGVDLLLRAFAKAEVRGAKLVLAGYPFHDFDLAAHQEMARQLGIEESVIWVAEYIASEEVVAWMKLAAVIVFPYRDIFQSGALHVAQTFGAPIIASAVGAMQDVITSESSGLLVPPEQIGPLADAVRRLLSDRPLAERLGAQAAADAQGPYSWQTIAGIVLLQYELMLKQQA
jgi:glycosyltransferase involved in cell wall biosynthesis